MTRCILSEIAASAAFLVFLFVLLLAGTAAIPYQPALHSEETQEGNQ